MKILVAGGGAFGREHLKTLTAMGGVTLALAEPRPAALEQLAASFPLALTDHDAVGILDRFAPDGLIIATPAAAHAPLAFTALERGTPVLVEKPVAPDAATMRQLCAAAERSPTFLQPGHILRFSAPHRQVHAIVAQGQIGDLLRITSRRYRDSSHADRYRDVDPVFTTMVHDIDLALWFDGATASEVRAMRRPRGDNRSLTAADIVSSRGTTWQLSLAWLHPSLECPPDRVELIGTAGSVELEVGRGIELYTGEGHRHIASDASDDPLRTELETFLAGIRAGRSVAPVTPDDALQGIVAAERIVAALA